MEGQTSGGGRSARPVGPTGQQDDQQDGVADQPVSVSVSKSVITVSELEYLSVTSVRRQLRDPDKPTGTLSEVAGSDTLLVVDVSVPPTGQGVTGEGDAQQGEVNTHTESSSTVTGGFSPQQQPFSSVKVGVPPLSLAALSPVSPRAVQPATSGRSSSFADQSQQKGEEIVTATVMIPSTEAG